MQAVACALRWGIEARLCCDYAAKQHGQQTQLQLQECDILLFACSFSPPEDQATLCALLALDQQVHVGHACCVSVVVCFGACLVLPVLYILCKWQIRRFRAIVLNAIRMVCSVAWCYALMLCG